MKYSIVLYCFFLGIQVLSASIFSEAKEASLPFYAKLVEDYTPENGDRVIPADTRFVLIRPLDDGKLLAEFPRVGHYELSLEQTNVQAEIERERNTDNVPNMPRMAYFLANRIMTGESVWQNPLRQEDVVETQNWFLLYGDSSEPELLEAVLRLDGYYRSLDETSRKVTVAVYLDTAASKAGIQAIADSVKPSIQAMPAYLSAGYCKSFQHYSASDEMPVLVEVSSSGRVLSKAAGLDAIQAFVADK
ncbi:hypothetical protein QEH52_09430 [Coraliomargarita sp. SDUM461003]|uniref:Uncharacterized protein n=1 Tax=Thalassobacterium maritimum TaxID=3041265 RepID=A0ABU1AUA1_9BACT|nr:hypothetical protein [Coraliomargarita sp. SDUM461003]MDQ8207730.1 hypothetical protein [Coraliomargarita sp. SDUM461003]